MAEEGPDGSVFALHSQVQVVTIFLKELNLFVLVTQIFDDVENSLLVVDYLSYLVGTNLSL